MRQAWFWPIAAALLVTAPVGAQAVPASTDSAWAAALLPVLRPLLPPPAVLAVGADSGDARSMALAAVLAAALGVPGPGAPVLRPENDPRCASPSGSAGPEREYGETAWVRWHPGDAEDRGMLAVAFTCRKSDGRPFAQGIEQRVRRGPDGRWRADGAPGGWTS